MVEREATQLNESVNGLFRNKVRVIQAVRGYRVSEDAIFLTAFVKARSGERILDAGTGCGVIAFGLAVKEPSLTVVGLEIQEALADRAGRGVRLNGLDARVFIVRGDVRQADRLFRPGSFDAVVSNPPYHEAGRGRLNVHQEKALSRHQLMMPLPDLVRISARLLRTQGRLSLIYPALGLERVKLALEESGFGLTRVLWIHPHEAAGPCLVCMEARPQSTGLRLREDALFLYKGPGERTHVAEALLAGEDMPFG